MGWFFNKKTTEDRLQEAEEALAGIIAKGTALHNIIKGCRSITMHQVNQLTSMAEKKAVLECRVNYLRRKLEEEKKGTVTQD